jgi:probable rRNA maturation factor
MQGKGVPEREPPHRHIEVTVREGIDPLLRAPELHRVLGRALEAAGAPGHAMVGLILTDDAEIAELNERHMGVSGATDVLAFPLLPPGAFPAHPGQDPAARERMSGRDLSDAPPFVLPPDELVHLGEIVISVERAASQAAEGRGGHHGDRRWAAADELRLLLTHGALHLCGWDHQVADEAAAMRDLERTLLRLETGEDLLR